MRSGNAEMLSASTTRPPIANTSLHAFAAAIAPKSDGSSTSGGKKSVVETIATSSLSRYTAASSKGAKPISSAGSAVPASSFTSADRGEAPHFAAHPPHDVHSVSRISGAREVMDRQATTDDRHPPLPHPLHVDRLHGGRLRRLRPHAPRRGAARGDRARARVGPCVPRRSTPAQPGAAAARGGKLVPAAVVPRGGGTRPHRRGRV